MIASGLTWFASSIGFYVHANLPYTAWLGELVDALLAQLLQYPSRELRSRLERAVLAAAYHARRWPPIPVTGSWSTSPAGETPCPASGIRCRTVSNPHMDDL
ncbi:MAG: hypothetical protein ACRDNT_22750 [Streptosporangiaceae bacterium]